MRSGWWWSTKEWEQYQTAYYAGRERPDEYKSSPLADDHEFDHDHNEYEYIMHQTQLLDLSLPLEQLWSGVRKSYHSLIHRADEQYNIIECDTMDCYTWVHTQANGGTTPRCQYTYNCQEGWLESGHGLLLEAWHDGVIVAAAYWIVYQGGAYYMSGPSIEKNVQHAVIWQSLELLKAKGIRLVELGQIDGETEKEQNIGKFKAGFGGTSVPFTIAHRRAS